MINGFSAEQRQEIARGVRQRYGAVAESPEGRFRFPTGRAGLVGLNYDPDLIGRLPEEVVACYCGVGQPFALGPVGEGEAVLDIGCGAGVDTLIAAMMSGPAGRGVGLDLAPEMVLRAKRNAELAGIGNASFFEGSAEELPFKTESFDVVISNGAFNLVPDKARALREVFRVLKPRGRFMIADQILLGQAPEDTGLRVKTWAR